MPGPFDPMMQALSPLAQQSDAFTPPGPDPMAMTDDPRDMLRYEEGEDLSAYGDEEDPNPKLGELSTYGVPPEDMGGEYADEMPGGQSEDEMMRDSLVAQLDNVTSTSAQYQDGVQEQNQELMQNARKMRGGDNF